MSFDEYNNVLRELYVKIYLTRLEHWVLHTSELLTFLVLLVEILSNYVVLNDFCDDDNLSTQLIMRLPSVGCHDMCFSITSELIQEFYLELFGIIFSFQAVLFC